MKAASNQWYCLLGHTYTAGKPEFDDPLIELPHKPQPEHPCLLPLAATTGQHGGHSDEDVESVHVNAHTPETQEREP